jgi:hypothetical protein
MERVTSMKQGFACGFPVNLVLDSSWEHLAKGKISFQ